MGSRRFHRVSAAVLGILTASATVLILTGGSTVAQAAVWTDQTDYSPGSVVTFNGDNSDGAGYQAGETVHVAVNGPGSIAPSCDATADASGAWSCQITLGTGAAAIGGYTYTATGQTTGVSQSGTFTDSGCKDANAQDTVLADPNLAAAFTVSGTTATYTVTTPTESQTSTGVPGLIEYCIYPGSTPPNSATASLVSPDGPWTGVIPNNYANHGYFDFEHPDGNPSNLPFDGSKQTVGTATWSGGVPATQLLVLHINDPNECDKLYGGNPGTCFVLPGTPSSGNSDLTVSKTATPSFTRTYTWTIAKDVNKSVQDTSGSATFNYTVNVTHDSGTPSNWQVNGTITVHDPNTADFTGVNVTDSTGGGGTCQVTDSSGGSNETIPAKGSLDLPYTCNYSSNPGAVTDTATATWDKPTYNTPDNSASGAATADFSTAAPTIVDGKVTVTDTLGATLGTVNYNDANNPTTFTYPITFTDRAGTCTTHNNTATFTTNTSGTTGSASQSVQVCVGADLTVSKNAAPSFTRTYTWGIAKTATPTLIEQAGGGTASASYSVSVNETGFTDSGWQVSGHITVTNPNDWEAVTANVTDAIDNGGACTVYNSAGSVDPTNATIPKSGTVTFPYTCSFGSNPSSGTNTATAAWDPGAAFTSDGSANGTAGYAFGAPTTTVNKTITVKDTFNNGTPTTLGTPAATDTQPFTSQPYNYTHTLNVPSSNCVTYPNTASIVETGQKAGASVEACGPAKTGALTMGYWQNKNGQGIITGGASTAGVCNSATWLRQYAPFQDLSATATCAQVATYVNNAIKAANASGAAMNAMLKAQTLATGLDVYFSDSSLGGNKISAPAPVGGVKIDLTKICHMIDSSSGTGTCSGTYENVSSAFGGSTSLTISQMLSYAASQSNVGGITWYGQVKATQGLAKDAFDAVNNQVVFSP
jgi:hypothetical protein